MMWRQVILHAHVGATRHTNHACHARAQYEGLAADRTFTICQSRLPASYQILLPVLDV